MIEVAKLSEYTPFWLERRIRLSHAAGKENSVMNRRIWSIEERTAIILEMIRGGASMAAFCTRHGLSASQAFAGWSNCWPGDALPRLTAEAARGVIP